MASKTEGENTAHSIALVNNEESVEDAKIIDGKAIAARIRQEITAEVALLLGEKKPGLAVVLVGSRPDSQTYVNMKKKACEAAGIVSFGFDFDENVTQEVMMETIQKLNNDGRVHGILVQLPLPNHLDQDAILKSVDPDKDVDGLHPSNVAALQTYAGHFWEASFSIPCTPLGCCVLLERSGVPLRGSHCVVLGRSQLVGWPMARLLLAQDATVTVVHSKTKNIEDMVRQADVIIAAVGRAEMVKGDWLKPGAVVIDVGINSVDTPGGKKPYKLVGDVEYASAKSVASKITPVPGGVGPMTIAMLLRNTLSSFKRMQDKV